MTLFPFLGYYRNVSDRTFLRLDLCVTVIALHSRRYVVVIYTQ